MSVIDDATAAFEEQAREFVADVADLPYLERVAALDAEIARLFDHRYLFTNERALEVLNAARGRA